MSDVLRNDPFTAVVPYDALTATVELFVDGVSKGVKSVTQGTAGSAEFPFPSGLTPGSYQFTAVAGNVDGFSPTSQPATLIVGGKVPTAPGTITFRFTE